MQQRKYFELFASVGRKSSPDKNFPYTVESLLEDMKDARIHGAAIMSNTAEDYSFIFGNREAVSAAKAEQRLVSIAAVPPTAILESGDPAYYDRLLDEGVRAFAVLPKAFHTSLHPKSMRAVAEALMSRGRPLIVVGTDSEARFEQAARLAEEYPDLPIIMQGTHWSSGRLFWEAMERCENLYFEISSNQINGVLKTVREHFGAERALYSSAWPKKSMGAMKAMIEYADISESDKDLIAHGNACRLLGLSIEDFPLYDDADCEFDEIAREADAGRPISVPVIDAHTHMVASEDKTMSGFMMLDADCDAMVRTMDRLGVETAITAPFSGITIDGKKGNEDTLHAALKYPGRFLGFSTCNVRYEEERQDWNRFHEEYPEIFVGVKPYWVFQKYQLTSELCKEWFSYANEHRLLLLVHCDGSDAISNQVEQLSLDYPDITFILAHSGMNFAVARKNAAIAKSRDNVVLEITFTSVARGMIEFLVEQVGADKVLYGSDFPMRDPAPQLGWVCYAKIPAEDKKKILAGNVRRLLERELSS